jgi:hypothetical protein
MEQNSPIDSVKTWLEARSPFIRGLVTVAILVVGGLVLVALICVIAGWTEPRALSDALFYGASAMFAISLVLYFGNRGTLPESEEEEEDNVDAQGPKSLLMKRRRRREIPFYAVTFIVAGVILFLSSIGLWYVLS